MKTKFEYKEEPQGDGSTVWTFCGDGISLRAVLCLLDQKETFDMRDGCLVVRSNSLTKEDFIAIADMFDIYPYYNT